LVLFLTDQGFIFVKDPLSPRYMQLLRETLERDSVIVHYSESKETEVHMYLHNFAFLAKIKRIVFYFLEHLSHDFIMVGLGSTAVAKHK